MTERTNVDFLGKVIGTCTGWNQWDTLVFSFEDFIPAPCMRHLFLEKDSDLSVTIDFESGEISQCTTSIEPCNVNTEEFMVAWTKATPREGQ